ncbi:HET-domain-containing protein [Trematosphaeria pertusa]|uniref:HET-domain-containing protein n=1 Tax=Trematosphaeria pertusa TaxID=390896 RepID=A0A6A6HRU8_9PLEO|nr:HET-domain-containing protein [Trematosphaeria pertusa]KAF2240884.1 HET-domain-containing protein [Trematosphaeria pertusa]
MEPPRLTHRPYQATPAYGKPASNENGQPRQLDHEYNRASGFHYPPIDLSTRQIRLVRVLPSALGSPIRCEFVMSSIDSTNYPYTALSYTWDDATSEYGIVKIILDGQDFWVRKNLWYFLHHTRLKSTASHTQYWIDAICINQTPSEEEDMNEKNHQVQLMGEIYSGAHMVVAWLGEPPERMIPSLERISRRGVDMKCLLDIKDPSSDFTDVSTRTAYLDLISRPYFTRVWVVQEIILARKIVFKYGSSSFNSIQVSNGLTQMKHLWDNYAYPHGLRIDRAIMEFLGLKSSNPLDKIYGLLGLLDADDIVPDYAKSRVDLYRDVLKACIRGIWRDWASRADELSMVVYVGYVRFCLLELLELDDNAVVHADSSVKEEMGIDWTAIPPDLFAEELGDHVIDINRAERRHFRSGTRGMAPLCIFVLAGRYRSSCTV